MKTNVIKAQTQVEDWSLEISQQTRWLENILPLETS